MATKNNEVPKGNVKPDWTETCENNVLLKIIGDTLFIEVDLSQDGEISKSGKSFNIGTTNGLIPLGGRYKDVRVGLNVIRKR